MGPYRILLDCGLEEGKPLTEAKEPPVDAVFCSHAHGDHARGLLALHEAFPQLPVYASEATVRLLPLNWPARLSPTARPFCQPLRWRTPIHLFEDLTAELFPAGHLPGAAAILLTYTTPQRTYKLFYTGDFSLSNLQLVEGLSLEDLRGLGPDVLIIEGSYGTARHPHRRQQEKHLMVRLAGALGEGQNILLPVPTLGLGQELLKLLRSHHLFTGRELDIWVGGSLPRACDAYLTLLDWLPISVQNFAKHQPLFWDERIYPRLRRLTEGEGPQPDASPYIVLTDEIGNLQSYCEPGAGAWLILVPEQGLHGLSPDAPPLSTLKNRPGMEVETYLLAEHSDGRNTTQLIHNLRPQHVIFVHGSPTYLADLTSLEELQNRYQLHSPLAGNLVELPMGEKFIQPAAPAPTAYEGELAELETCVTVTLPDSIIADPRWSRFGDTGLVEARWQGEELVLRGLSQRELLRQSSQSRIVEDTECCQTCRYFRGQRCWHEASPLYGFKVTPDGYCPVFEHKE